MSESQSRINKTSDYTYLTLNLIIMINYGLFNFKYSYYF